MKEGTVSFRRALTRVSMDLSVNSIICKGENSVIHNFQH